MTMFAKRLTLAAILLLAPLAAHADATSDQIARGQYLTRAADCQACHSAPGGQPFAGGRAFVLPFGTLYSPNITPDAATGIAGYSDHDWLRMIHDGVGRGDRHLYPAMPYPSYTGMSDGDALAIKAYLLSLKPVAASPPPNKLSFPFNQRWGMVAWNLLNNPDKRFTPDDSKSADYNRGAYLVENLGHCGECHTPRNFMMATKSSDALAGYKQAGWMAYNITSDQATGLGGWSDAQIEHYLSTGYAPGHGPASGPMAEAVSDSLRYLSPGDIHAITVYLRAVPARTNGVHVVAASGTPPVSETSTGAQLFQDGCQGCHLPNGQGRQSPWASLAGAQTVGDPDGTNIVQILTQGSAVATPMGTMFMHPFTGAYTDAELADLANYTISQFGYRQGDVTTADVAKIRAGKAQ
jgi:mono/diheme cytochrome c family protein